MKYFQAIIVFLLLGNLAVAQHTPLSVKQIDSLVATITDSTKGMHTAIPKDISGPKVKENPKADSRIRIM